MDRKSPIEKWYAARRAARVRERHPAQRRAAMAVAEDLLRELAREGNLDAARLLDDDVAPTPVEVSGLDHDIYTVVEALRLEHGEDKDALKEAVLKEFGMAEPDALKIHSAVLDRLARASRSGRPALAVPLTGDVQRDEELMEAIVAARRKQRPPRMRTQQIIRYALERSIELGLDPARVMSKEQGRRSADARAVQDARARLVVELRDRGATRTDIGAVLGGRTKQSVEALERAGRQLSNKQQKGERDG
jgi:hypothetical protein